MNVKEKKIHFYQEKTKPDLTEHVFRVENTATSLKIVENLHVAVETATTKVMSRSLVEKRKLRAKEDGVKHTFIFSVNDTDGSYCDFLVDYGAITHILNDDSKFI